MVKEREIKLSHAKYKLFIFLYGMFFFHAINFILKEI